MAFKPTKIVYLDSDQIKALDNLAAMRVSELEIVQENPTIISFYKNILEQLRR